MANGSHALKTLAPEPCSSPPPEPHSTALETTLGAAVAGCGIALCAALPDRPHLGIDPQLREAGGAKVACLAELWLAHDGSDDDFIVMAREQGRLQLRQFLPSGFVQHHGAGPTEEVLAWCIDVVVEITSKVVRTERAMRRAEAH